ncbi:uncharacterized mitochondrial protein-like protein [Tanacetum coccineum]
MGDTIAQTRFENVSKLSNDPLLARGNTLRNGEDSLKLKELMELCTNLQTRVLDLEKTKTTQAKEIVSLKRRVKKPKQKKEGRINAIDADEDINLVNDQDDADMFDVNTLTGDDVLAEPDVSVKDVNLTVYEVTLAQELASLKSVNPKVKANVVEESSVPVSAASTKISAATTTTTATIPTPRKGIVITALGTSTTTTISLQPSQEKVQDKGKGITVEEHVKSMKMKDLVKLDEEIASKLQAEFDEEERLAREKDEANVALTEEWDDIQAKVDADYQLAQRLQAQEQEELTDEEKARLFVQFLEQRRKHFAAKRAEEKRNKPPTQAQQRKIMCTYLKNMEGKKPKDLKNKSFDSIQKMFDRAFKRVNTFVDFRTDLVEGSSKRAGDELEQEVTKKQKVDDVQETAKVDDDQETAKIKELMKIVSDEEEVAIDAIPLATNPPTIGSVVGIKSFLMLFGITDALIDVNAAQSKLYKVNAAEGVNAANEEVSTAELNKDKFLDLPSFASVTNGIAKPTVDTSSTNANIRDLVLNDQDLINVEDPSMVLLVNLKDVNSMSYMYVICRNKEILLVEVHGVNYDVHVQELGTWNINIVYETIDSFDNLDVNGMEKVKYYIDKSSLADLNDLKETINELASNEIQHPISKENIGQEDDINKVSPEIAVSSDLSRPPGFEHMKRTSSKCSTSFARYRKKDIKGVSLIEELSRIIEVGDSLDVDNFNFFNNNSGLIDLPLGGHLFTWMNKARTKLSKLDRSLISKEVAEALHDVRVTAIDHLWSDHNHILLYVSKSDLGPTPFKLFHSWLLHDSFDKVIKMELPNVDPNP